MIQERNDLTGKLVVLTAAVGRFLDREEELIAMGFEEEIAQAIRAYTVNKLSVDELRKLAKDILERYP